MKMKWIDNLVRVVSFLFIVGCVLTTFLQVTTNRSNAVKTKKIINLIYKFQDTNTLVANAEVLEGLCESDVFSILDNREKSNVTRRFNTYTTTVPSIVQTFVEGDTVSCIVSMNSESGLKDRLITITYNKDGLVSDYVEREFINRFDRKYDYVGDFKDGGYDTIGAEEDEEIDEFLNSIVEGD